MLSVHGQAVAGATFPVPIWHLYMAAAEWNRPVRQFLEPNHEVAYRPLEHDYYGYTAYIPTEHDRRPTTTTTEDDDDRATTTRTPLRRRRRREQTPKPEPSSPHGAPPAAPKPPPPVGPKPAE